MLQQAHELVRVEPAAEAAPVHHPGVEPGDSAQQPVPGRNPEHVVDQLEILDVGADHIVALLGILGQQLLGLPVEKLLAVKPGQPVVLELVDHGRRLPQIDDAGHAVQDHLGLVGLCHEIGGPVSQGRHLVGLAVILRGDDHRDGRVVGRGFHDGQKGIAVHHGHHQIQQNEGYLILVPFQQGERLLPVFRFQHLILIGQYRVQHSPVDLVVLNHQYCFIDHCFIPLS